MTPHPNLGLSGTSVVTGVLLVAALAHGSARTGALTALLGALG